MSAIVGIYDRAGAPASSEELRRMASTLAYRGPDKIEYWLAGPVGLATLVLWSTPEASGETLPHTEGGLVITADARLDNRAELIDQLGFAGTTAPPGDAALILAAYRRWGEQAPQHLLGDFAFAIWDGARRRLFCARDHFGLKHFYYYCTDQFFAFATEIKALLVSCVVPRRLNESRLGAMLTMALDDDKESTLYQNILRLAPATSLLVEPQRFALSTYWRLDPTREIRLGSDAEYADAYRQLLTAAVDARLRSKGLVGAALSGGLDSSAVASLARDILVQRSAPSLNTFSSVFDAVPVCDERHYIEAVVGKGNVTAQFVHPDLLDPLGDWEIGPWQEDEPLWVPQTALSWAVYVAARDSGIRVMLEGYGGDSAVGHGAEYLSELLRRGRLVSFTREASLAARRLGRSPRALIARELKGLLPAPLRSARRRLRPQSAAYYEVPLRPEFVRRIGLRENGEHADSSGLPPHRRAQWQQLTSALVPSFSLVFMDRLAARMGIDARVPFLDRRLVEFCLALPPEQKLQDGWTRMIARRAMDGVLPEAVRWRAGKANLRPALSYGLSGPGRTTLADALLEEPNPIADYVDMSAARDLYDRFLAKPDDGGEFALWRVASLGLWLRRVA